jgi:predicted RNA binding protein YcfA (HicA-like mRNA interferase family)
MPALPVLSGRKTVRAFERLGWQVARQRGSHIIMVKEGEITTLSIPEHKEERWTPKTGPVVKIDFCQSAVDKKEQTYESKTQTA